MRRLTIIVVFAVALGGCAVQSSSDRVPRTLEEARAAAAAEQSSDPHLPDGTESDAGAVQDQTQTSGDHQGTGAASDEDAGDGGPPQRLHSAGGPGSPPSGRETEPSKPAGAPEEEHPFRFEVELSSRCVRHGESMMIEVRTEPDASVAYHAVYAGDEGGAIPPYGEGHGGNGGDPANGEGRYSDTWVVGPDAPEGPARVDVVAAYYGEMTRTALVFEVADRVSGTCGGAA